MLLPLFNKMRRAQPELRVCCTESLVALMHTRWDICRLATLITTRELTIKDFKDQYTHSVGIHRSQRMALDSFPAAFDNFWRCVSSCVRDNAPVCLVMVSIRESNSAHWCQTHIYNCIIFLHRAQDIKSSQFPFTAFAGIN